MNSSSQDGTIPLTLFLKRNSSAARSRQDSELCDEDLISRLDHPHAGALEVLFNRYSRLVFSIGQRILSDVGESEELVQEVFLAVHQKAKLFDQEKGTAKAWIIQIAYNRAYDRRSYLLRRQFYAGTELESAADSLSGGSDLEHEIGWKLTREQMRRAFQELSENQRRTLELFFFEGLEFSEIAERLNEPIGNIRHYYYRGLDKLRKSTFIEKLRNKSHE